MGLKTEKNLLRQEEDIQQEDCPKSSEKIRLTKGEKSRIIVLN